LDEGHIGLHYVIDMYRRYSETIRPLLKILIEGVAITEGKPLPAPVRRQLNFPADDN
jgi:hypothetical protein